MGYRNGGNNLSNFFNVLKTNLDLIQSKVRAKVDQRSYLRLSKNVKQTMSFHSILSYVWNQNKGLNKCNLYMLLKTYFGLMRSKFREKVGQAVTSIRESRKMSQKISCYVLNGEVLQVHLFLILTMLRLCKTG